MSTEPTPSEPTPSERTASESASTGPVAPTPASAGGPGAGGAPVDRTSSPLATRRARPLTGMAILLPVLLLGGAVWLGRSLQPADDGTVRPTQNGMVGASETPVPGPTEGPDGGETPDRPFTTFTVVLPTDDGKMERKSIPVPKNTPAASDPAAARDQWANIALNTLLSGEAKSFFPAGTQPAGPVTVESDALTVNLNAAFATGADSWSSAEAIARVMSIVNTVAATDQQITGRVTPVRVLIDGKPVSTLGPLDTAEPMMPDSALVPAS